MVELSAVVACIAVVPGSCAYFFRHSLPVPIIFALTHAAATGALVALASSDRVCKHTTWLLGKGREGRISSWSWLLMWPYHVGLRVKLLMRPLLSSEPLYNKVLPGWYIGGWPGRSEQLPASQASVLDVTCELPRTHNSRYLCLPTWDTQAPSVGQIEQGVEWALKESAAGRSVYVHCAHGHGRSATLLAACLLASGAVSSGPGSGPGSGGAATSVDSAIKLLKAVRPKVHLNRKQRGALEAWHEARCSARGSADDHEGQRPHCASLTSLSERKAHAAAAAAATAAAAAMYPSPMHISVSAPSPFSSTSTGGGVQGHQQGQQGQGQGQGSWGGSSSSSIRLEADATAIGNHHHQQQQQQQSSAVGGRDRADSGSRGAP